MGTYHGAAGPCHRCGRGGHLARDCSLHTCFRCNGRGHMAWECVEGVTCSKCGEKGHLQRNCKNVSCHKCGRKGHIAKFCNDPFAKAAEVEKNERQQALILARAAGSNFPTVAERGIAVTRGTVAVLNHKETPGPWDGLGVTTQRDAGSVEKQLEADKISVFGQESGAIRSSLVGSRKRMAASVVQAVVSQRVRIVGVKRDGSPRNDISGGFEAKSSPSCTVESSPLDVGRAQLQWKGLVGYESDDSEDHSMHSLQIDRA